MIIQSSETILLFGNRMFVQKELQGYRIVEGILNCGSKKGHSVHESKRRGGEGTDEWCLSLQHVMFCFK